MEIIKWATRQHIVSTIFFVICGDLPPLFVRLLTVIHAELAANYTNTRYAPRTTANEAATCAIRKVISGLYVIAVFVVAIGGPSAAAVSTPDTGAGKADLARKVGRAAGTLQLPFVKTGDRWRTRL